MEALRLEEGNPGLELGLQLGEGWQSGRDKVCIDSHPSGFGLWAEQLLAESTGKQGKGLVPAPGESPDGPDRQRGEVRLSGPVRARAGVAPVGVRDRGRRSRARDQPVRPARRPGREGQDERGARGRRAGRLAARLARRAARQARRGRLRLHPGVHRPGARDELAPLVARAHETGCVVTSGLGPRYLHSTGQLHKGGPNTGLFIQVVDDTGEELAIPGRDFGFGRLIRSQAAGDLAALEERGRRVVRIRLEDI